MSPGKDAGTTMANYLLMIYSNEAAWEAADPSIEEEVMREHMAFGQAYGHTIRGGERLAGSATATSIRHSDRGETTLTDGIFAETREVLAGFYIVEADDLDAALEIAKHVPARFGGVEVRPIINS